MTKNKYFMISGGVIGLAVVLGLGFWIWPGHTKPKARVNVTSSQSSGSSGITLGESRDSSAISLTPDSPKPSTNNEELKVAQNSPGINLGQLNSGSSNSSKEPEAKQTTPSPFDPTTFAQYDKYQNDKGALFADVQVGTGSELTANMKAAVYYKGWLTNGQLFDQSRPDDKGQLQPFVFTMGAHAVIAGWEQALYGMKAGGVRLVIVPPAAGYGATGQGSIPPNAVLIFQVQLAAVQ